MQFKEDIKVSTEEYLRTYYTFNVGDIAFEGHQSKEFRFGRFVENDIGDGIVSHIFAVFRPIVDYDLKFWKYAINNESLMQRVLSRSTKASTMMHDLVTDDFLEQSFLVPSVGEQKQIGEFLAGIDNLITLHQSKYISYNDYKCYYYTISWEQRKLGEVFEEYSEKNHEELPALTIIQGGGTILREESDRALQYDKSSLSNYKMVRKDDFIVHLRSFEGGLEKANTDGIISPAYHTFHGDNTDSRFYYPFFRSRRFIDVLLKPHVYGIRDGKSIDIEGMKSIMIPVPSYNEQKAIGGYIETLDNLITLHQEKYVFIYRIMKNLIILCL